MPINYMPIDNFKAHLQYGGARANLFRVEFTFPAIAARTASNTIGTAAEEMGFLCKAAVLPSSTIDPIPMNFRGRQLQLIGDRKFDPWTITVINDNDFMIRDMFESWMNVMNEHVNNIGNINPITMYGSAVVHQLNKGGVAVKSYDMRDLFPSNLQAIDVSYDSENTVEEFTVDLQVGTYWVSNTTT